MRRRFLLASAIAIVLVPLPVSARASASAQAAPASAAPASETPAPEKEEPATAADKPAPTPTKLLPAAGQFVPLDGERVLSTTLPAGGSTTFGVTGNALPKLDQVLAVALSVQASDPAADGFLAVVKPGETPDQTLRYVRGQPATGYEVVRPSAEGLVSLYASAATGVTVHLRGYYTSDKAGRAGGTFTALPGISIVDGTGRTFTSAVGGAGGLPKAAEISAVAVSLQVHAPSSAGCVTAGGKSPSLCYRPGADAVAFDTLTLSRSGEASFAATSTVRLTVRVTGYYSAPTSPVAGATYVPLATRIVLRTTKSAAEAATAAVAGTGGVPKAESVAAVAINAEASVPEGAGCLTVGTPARVHPAVAPNACFHAGDNAVGFGVARLDEEGRLASSASAKATMTVRLRGYFHKAAAPAAPRAVTAVRGDGRALVSWSKPKSDGGAAVTDYVVTASPGGATARSNGLTRATVTGLSNTKSYTFTVTAVNAAGTGAPSPSSNRVTPTAGTGTAQAPMVSAADANATLTIDGPAVNLTAPAGARAVYTFAGNAGQRVFTTINVISIVDWGNAVLTAPSGATLAEHYVFPSSDHADYLDAVTLPATGTYTVTITTDSGGATYQTRVTSVPADARATATVGGAAAQVAFSAPGQNGVVEFSGTAGTRLFTRYHIDSTSDHNSCLEAFLLDPSGGYLNGSCAKTGYGHLTTVTLPVTGTYRVQLDPEEAMTGAVSVTLLVVPPDATVNAAVNGTAYSTTVTYGQGVYFAFTGRAGQKIHIEPTLAGESDVLTGWLIDPAGEFLQYSASGRLTTTLTSAGAYRYWVRPEGAQIGTLNAFLDEVPADVAATATIGGPAVTLTTSAPWQGGSLTFSASAQQQVYISCVPSTGDLTINLLDPAQNYLAFGCSADEALYRGTLVTAGTYRLQMYVTARHTASITVRITTIPSPVTATATVGGPPVTLTTTQPGQLAEVRFTASAGQRAYASCDQSLAGGVTNVSSFQLLTPSGSPIGSSNHCYGDDPPYVDTQDLAAGTYTVRVTLPDTATGSLTIQIHPVPAAATVAATIGGAAVSVTTTAPGQEGKVTFTATAGQRLYVYCLQDIPRTDWGWTSYYLVGPFGDVSPSGDCSPAGSTVFDTRTLPVAGTYTIEIYPSSTSFGTARLQLYSPAADSTATATIGGPAVTVATTTPGQDMSVGFAATAGDRIYATCRQRRSGGTANDYISYQLFDPVGNYADGDTFQHWSNCVDPSLPFEVRVQPTLFNAQTISSTGTYTIDIDPGGLITGSTTIQIYRVPADVTATATVGGPAVTVTTTAIGQEASVSFDGTANQRLLVSCTYAMTGNAGKPPFYLFSAPGSEPGNLGYCENQPVLFDTWQIGTTGRYTIRILPRGLAVGSFTIRLYSPPADVTATATIGGGAVTVTTTATGQKARLTFSGSVNQRLFVTCSQTTSGDAGKLPSYQLLTPDGQVSTVGDCSGAPVLFDTQKLAASGTYTIAINPPGLATGTFTVRLYSPPADVAATATVGGPAVGVTTTAPGQKASVTFTGAANQRVFVSCTENLANRGSGYTNYVLADPSGAQVAFGLCSSPPVLFSAQTLPAAGTYKISASPPGIATGTITMRIYPVPPDVTATATVDGAATTVTTTGVGQKAYLTFTATAGQQISATCSQTVNNGGSAYPDYELDDPTGFPIAFGDCSAPPALFAPVPLDTTGEYTIMITPPGLATGSFTVQLHSAG